MPRSKIIKKIGDFILASQYDDMMYKHVHRLELQNFSNFCAAHFRYQLG